MAPPIAKLAAILGSCRPDAGLQKGGSAPSSSSSSNGARARSAANDTDYCSPPVFERLVREMSDIESILYDYKEMQTRVLELTRELRALRRQGVVPGMQPSMPVAAHPAAAAATVRPAKRARANVSCI